jgi:hypothetical protein
MKTFFGAAWSIAILASIGFADDTETFVAVRHADEERIAATIAGDTVKLATLLSDDLRYAYSDGRVQTKPQFIEAVGANKVKYLSLVPKDLRLQVIVPGAVAVNGFAHITAASNSRRVEFTLHFLAVWREESGKWRLLAYQSSQPVESPPAPSK